MNRLEFIYKMRTLRRKYRDDDSLCIMIIPGPMPGLIIDPNNGHERYASKSIDNRIKHTANFTHYV